MIMGTCKEDSEEQPEANQGPIVEDNFITGPPASRTVIDNLKKLLVKRQHSRDSDYENKQKSTSGSNSDAAFYSQFSTSSSDSESDSDAYLIFEDISNQDNRKSSSGSRRKHRRQRSYSSSSSSTRSPAEKRRRKPSKAKKAGSSEDQSLPATGGGDLSSPQQTATTTAASREEDSANSTSSHKDSSSSDEENVNLSSVQASTDDKNPVTNQTRLPKFRSRRDRNRKRRRSETNYANDRPNSNIPTIVISHIEDSTIVSAPAPEVSVHDEQTAADNSSANPQQQTTPEEIQDSATNPTN